MKIGVNGRTLVSNLTGLGRYAIEMCRELARRGHQVIIYQPSHSSNDSTLDPEGIEYRIGKAENAISRNIWAQTTLPLLAKRDRVDLFWGPAHRLPSFLDRRIARVITIHDLVWKDMATTMRWQTWMADRWLMKPGIAIADEVVADSNATAKALQAEFPSCAEKLNVVYPGLSAIGGGDRPNSPASFGIDGAYILFVGTLEPRKNLLRLMEAYASLPETMRSRLSLVLAGGQGWRLGDLKKHIEVLKIGPSVRLTGYVSDADLAELYKGARFLAMPSLYEGFGFPLIEANAMGIPVLTSNVSSMPEVAGNAGILINPTDIRSIREGLEILATDDVLHARLSGHAKSNAARFDWSASARQLEAVFEKAIEKRRRSIH